MLINFEFKALTNKLESLEQKLLRLNPIYTGEDNQVDIYFNVKHGRLKLREGNIENALIYYERPDIYGPKKSDVLIYEHTASPNFKTLLTRVHGIKTIVEKKRKIYFIDNVKFHFDIVKSLGSFVEVEAIDKTGVLGLEKITEQCMFYARLFDIKQEDYINVSYSDMLLDNRSEQV